MDDNHPSHDITATWLELVPTDDPAIAERVSHALVATFPPIDPPPEVWDRIVERIGGDAPPVRQYRLRFLAPLAVAALIALVLAVVAVLPRPTGGDVLAVRELVDTTTGEVVMEVSIGEDGASSLEAMGLPVLDADSTYQLWAVVGDEVVSVGVLGPDPAAAPLHIEGDPTVLALTVEQMGGVAVSSQTPVAVWQVTG